MKNFIVSIACVLPLGLLALNSSVADTTCSTAGAVGTIQLNTTITDNNQYQYTYYDSPSSAEHDHIISRNRPVSSQFNITAETGSSMAHICPVQGSRCYCVVYFSLQSKQLYFIFNPGNKCSLEKSGDSCTLTYPN
jgi:hypothetical protein